jgi:hypothetical protein
MDKKIIVHENVYEDYKTTKPKKQKWITAFDNNTPNLFQSFQVGDEYAKKIKLADKRLKLAGLSTKLLDEKYGDVTDCILMIADLDGVTMWANTLAWNILGDGQNPVLQTTRLQFAKLNKGSQQFQAMFEDMHQHLPKYTEIEETLKTPGGNFAMRLRYVRFVGSLIFLRNE